MEKIILYVDDAAYARDHLTERLAQLGPALQHVSAVQWVLVACAPRMTHRISKWVSHSARENWRAKWFAKVLHELEPVLRQGGHEVTPLLAKGPLAEFTQQLRMQYGAAALVLDARRPKIGVDMEPVTIEQRAGTSSRWTLPGAVASMGALLVVASELGE